MSAPLVQRVPAGHERTASGLIVPTESIQRERLVMSHDQQRKLDRVIADVLVPMRLRHILVCADQRCPSGEVIVKMEAHGLTLECGCARREIHRTV